MRSIAFLCVVALLAVGGASCGGDSEDASDTVAATTGPDGGDDGGPAGDGDDASGDDSSGDNGNGSDDDSPDGDDDDGDGPATTNQVELADVALSDLGAIDVGNAPVGDSRSTPVELVSRDEDRTLTRLEVGGRDAPDFAVTGGDCRVGGLLVEDQPCTLVLTFAPSARGTRKGVLTIGVNPPVGRQVRLVGRGGIGVLPDDDQTLTDPDLDVATEP